MTDKKIIVGVDISGCEFLTKTGHCKAQMSIMGTDTNKCKCFPNCYYKQLQHKEQSEERLVKQIQTICDFINNRLEIFKDIQGSVDKIITEYAERKEQECEELKEQLKKEIEASQKWYQLHTDEYFAKLKLKQTLAEIKEIAKYKLDNLTDSAIHGGRYLEILDKISEVQNDRM